MIKVSDFSNILLASDLDGTLVDRDGKLPEANRKAIAEFKLGGGRFCICTGRLPGHLLQFFRKDEFNCPVICCNGACVYDFATDRVLYECLLGDKVREVADYVAKNTQNVVRAYYFKDMSSHNVDFEKMPVGEIAGAHKMVLDMGTEAAAIKMRDALNARFGDAFSFSRSWSVGVEILNINATKGRTVMRLKEILGDNRKAVCVGDYENDISMIEMADIGCAVENAVPELKAAADKVVCSNNDGAIRYIVENVLEW